MIASDDGTEFTSNSMLAWTQQAKVGMRLTAPGEPMQNSLCERSDGRICSGSFGKSLFYGLAHDQTALARRVANDNQERLHSPLHD